MEGDILVSGCGFAQSEKRNIPKEALIICLGLGLFGRTGSTVLGLLGRPLATESDLVVSQGHATDVLDLDEGSELAKTQTNFQKGTHARLT